MMTARRRRLVFLVIVSYTVLVVRLQVADVIFVAGGRARVLEKSLVVLIGGRYR